MKGAYYNEIDPFAAQWLRELIKAGQIADGEVDERSIEDVLPTELVGFKQCHFFAGIGVWSYALRLAGWPDDRPVWTASLPCQPFSQAGKGGGFADERHLWPAFSWLIAQCRPSVIFGEQVAGKVGEGWFDVVRTDLEAEGYAAGLSVFPACGVGAPHLRKRLYWVAESEGAGYSRRGRGECNSSQDEGERGVRVSCGEVATRSVADAAGDGQRKREHPGDVVREAGSKPEHEPGVIPDRAVCRGADGGMADAEGKRECADEPGRDCGEAEQLVGAGPGSDGVNDGTTSSMADASGEGLEERERGAEQQTENVPTERCGDIGERPCPTNGHWRSADWLFCRDGKWRPVESFDGEMDAGIADRLGYSRIGDRYSLNPLKEKAENRVMRLRGYGNSIVAQQAKAWIETIMEEGEG